MGTSKPLPAEKRHDRHVVLLGSGASFACCPKGDGKGRPLPVFANFTESLQLRPMLEGAGVYVTGENFETTFSRLAADSRYADLVAALEKKVFDYFNSLTLPDAPCLYDHLILSLRPTDIIASFNWDPLLIGALKRCRYIAEPPLCLFLHGNVAMGHCTRHAVTSVGDPGNLCKQCQQPLVNSKLLYPVVNKGYSNDPQISRAWTQLDEAFKHAFVWTTFGYSAPSTDVDAIALLQKAWGTPQQRSLEEMEFIDIKSEDEIVKTWSSFIHTHHYQVHRSFYDSTLGLLPRRSIEGMRRQLLHAEFIDTYPIPKDANWDELRAWVQPLVDAEASVDSA